MSKFRLNTFSVCKVLSFLMVFLYVFSIFPSVFAENTQTVTINVGSASGKYGDTVTIPVSFQGVTSAGINNFDFKLEYNSYVLEAVKVTPGSIITNPNGNFSSLLSKAGEVSFMFMDESQGKNPIKSNGICANVEFKIKNGVAFGPSQINASFTINTFADKDLNTIKVDSNSGIITVINTNVPTPTTVVSPSASAVASSSPSTVVTPNKTPVKEITTPIVVLKENLPNLPAGIPADLVVNISANKSIYTEDEIITYTVKYLNRLNKMATNITISADIPEKTTLVDSAGGKVNGNKIEWTLSSLPDRKTGEITYKVKVGQLSAPQTVFSSTASINSSDNVLVNNDNKSVFMVMLYSNKLEQPKHIKYVNGYSDNTIKPDKEITRAEVAVMFAKILELDISDNTKLYNDVSSSHWACKYVNAVSKAGLFKGYGDGKIFKPNDPITRAELATAIFRNLKLSEVTPLETNFSDVIRHWSWKYVEEVYRLKLVNGYGKGQFAPNNKIKRSEVMTMLNRMTYRGPLKGTSITFKDLSAKHWAYGQIAESTVDHSYTISPDGYETAVGVN